MKTYEIYKTYLYYTMDEINELIVEMMNGCDHIETEDEAEEEVEKYIQDTFYDEIENIRYANKRKFNNQTFAIIGEVGRWDGSHEIVPYYCNSLIEAIQKCIDGEYDFRIYEDQYGNLKIETANHDGRSYFTIKKVVSGNEMRCVHFRREVWGC